MSASDAIELVLAAALLLCVILWRGAVERILRGLAGRTAWCMILLALLPIALRLLLLPHHPVPTPDVYDEFGHLFVADTLMHGRLANLPHPLHQFFETFFILQTPTYSSIYPIGQGLAMEIGRVIFGIPWAGVVLSTAAFCALCYWMLRGWTTPLWSLAGGLLAVIEFGPLNTWMNSYWGGAFAAAGGCLVFGSLPRLRRGADWRVGALLGIGMGICLLTRPYESIFVLIAVIVYVLPKWRDPALIAAVIFALPAVGLTLLQNKRVTGSWTTLPYSLSQKQYGVPAALTFLSNPVPDRALTVQQQLEYKAQLAFRDEPESIKSYLLRLEFRVRYYRFFFLPPLFIALLFFLGALKERRLQWMVATLILFVLGINFFPAFQFHYLAPVACLFVLMSVIGLARLHAINATASRLLLFLCFAQFSFWYAIHLFDLSAFSIAMRPYETWDGLNHDNPARRIAVNRELETIPGKLLIFVRYAPQHIFQDEWVYNRADIDTSRIVWARDLGEPENAKLGAYYPDRTVLLLEPDGPAPVLSPYQR